MALNGKRCDLGWWGGDCFTSTLPDFRRPPFVVLGDELLPNSDDQRKQGDRRPTVRDVEALKKKVKEFV